MTSLATRPDIKSVRCVAKVHPFRTVTSEYWFPRKTTVAAIVDAIVDEKWPRDYIHVQIDGQPLHRKQWRAVRPKSGHLVTVVVIPANDETKTALGFILVLLGTFLFAPLILVGRVLALSGASNLLANSETMSDRNQSGDRASPTFFIEGARNETRPWRAIPRPMGQHVIVPPYGAPPFTEIVGDDQFLRILFIIGYGPQELTEMKIGQTSLDDFADVETEIHNGFPSDDDLTLFANTVLTTALNLDLTTSFQTQTSEIEADEIVVEILHPQGWFRLDNDGVRRAIVGTIDVEYTLTSAGFPGTTVTERIDGAHPSPFIRAIRIPVSRGQYDVRVKRNEEDSASTRVADEQTWVALKTVRSSSPINIDAIFPGNTSLFYGGLAMVALRIRATDQLQNIIDTFNVKTRSILWDFDSWSLDFGAASTPLDAQEFSTITGAGLRSAECWAYARDTDTSGLMQLGNPDDALEDFSLYLKTAATETWTLSTGNAAGIDVVLAGSVGAWHHYAIVYNGANVFLHYDGVEKINAARVLATPVSDTLIGQWDGNMFDGKIREFRVWNSSKSAADFLLLKDIIISAQIANLILYHRMSEGSGVTVYNHAPRGLRQGGHLPIDQSTGPVWVRGEPDDYIWEPRPTRNPASCYRAILEGPANKRALPIAQIDETNLEEWHNDNKITPEFLDVTFNMEVGASHLWIDLDDVGDYVTQLGDTLEYDIYWPEQDGILDNHQIAIDGEDDDGHNIRDTGEDQNALSAAAETDISAFALGKWYHRSIGPLGEIAVGHTFNRFLISCSYDAGGSPRAWIKNINVMDGLGTVRKTIWNEGDPTPSQVVESTSSATQTWSIISKVIRDNASGRTFDHIFDYRTNIQNALQTVAGSAKASANVLDGKYGVVVDKKQLTARAHITPVNSFGFRASKVFQKELHALRVRFFDKEQNYQQTELPVYDDGFDVNTATKFEGLDAIGITSADEAWRFGRYILAQLRLRPETYEVGQDFEYLAATRGDLVKINHDVMLVGLGYGRVKSVTVNGVPEVLTITIDGLFTMEAAKSYTVVVWLETGESVIHPIDLDVGAQATLTLTTPTTDDIQAGNMLHFGEAGSEDLDAILQTITPEGDNAARLTLVPASPAVHDADDGLIPPFDPRISSTRNLIRRVEAPQIDTVTTEVTLRVGRGRQAIIFAHYFFESNDDERARLVEGQLRLSGTGGESWESLGTQAVATNTYAFLRVATDERYDIRIRAQGDRFPIIWSDWAQRDGIFVTGNTIVPPDIPEFHVVEMPTGHKLYRWNSQNMHPQVVEAELRAGLGSGIAWENMVLISRYPLNQKSAESLFPLPGLAGTTFTFGIKARDTDGLYSANARTTEATLLIIPFGTTFMFDERNLSWPGTITGYEVLDHLDAQGNGILAANDTKTWADFAFDGRDWDNWNTWPIASSNLVYLSAILDLGGLVNLDANAKADGKGTITLEVDSRAVLPLLGAWRAVGSGAVNHRYWQFRATVVPVACCAELHQFIRWG